MANVPSGLTSAISPVQFSAYRQIFVVCLDRAVLQDGAPSRQLSHCCPSVCLYTANKESSNKLSKNSLIGHITTSLLTIPPTRSLSSRLANDHFGHIPRLHESSRSPPPPPPPPPHTSRAESSPSEG
jgi:hypothetical protein